MLTIKEREEYFAFLGLGAYNKANILRFQKIAFPTLPHEQDGKYGKKTDTALRHWRNVKKYAPNFRPEEFKCKCNGRYCTGYPARMKKIQLQHIQKIRDHYGKPMTVTSGLRCKTFNAKLSGSSRNSRHLTGYATDFYIAGVTDSLSRRKSAIRYIRGLKHHRYTYGNGYNSNGVRVYAPNMGNALHTDTE